MAEAGADVLVAHMGLTTGGTIGAETGRTLDDCVELVQAIRDAAVEVNPDVIVLCHGGPDRRARRRRVRARADERRRRILRRIEHGAAPDRDRDHARRRAGSRSCRGRERQRPRFLVVTPVDEGWRDVKGARWYFHGGERYRSVAEAALSPHGQVEHLDWTPDQSVESFAEDAGRGARRGRRPGGGALVRVRRRGRLRRGAPGAGAPAEGDRGDVRLPAGLDRPG